MKESEDLSESVWMLPGASFGEEGGTSDSADGRSDQDKATDSSGRPFKPLNRGLLLNDRFELEGMIGRGGMGVIYRATDQLRGEAVAVKVILPGLLEDADAVRLFKAEAALAMRLSHPNIVTMHDIFTVDGSYGLVMELLVGHTLREEIRNRSEKGESFSLEDVCRVLAPICDALTYAHEMTVHRDLKPENIWLGADGVVKLMDFGLAKVVHQEAGHLSWQTLSQLRLGSPYYMAPEQLQDASKVTGASDQFALGVITYEMLTGTLPIGLAKPLKQARPDLPYPLTETVDRALASDPGSRFPSVAAYWKSFLAGSQARRTAQQLLDTKPTFRRTLKAIGALILVAGGLLWGTEKFRQNLAVHETRARASHDRFAQAGAALRNLGERVEAMRRRKAQALEALERVEATPISEVENLRTHLQREVQLAEAESEKGEAMLAWDLVSLRLRAGGLPSRVYDAYVNLEETLRSGDFKGFDRALDRFNEISRAEKEILLQIPSWAELRIKRSIAKAGTAGFRKDLKILRGEPGRGEVIASAHTLSQVIEETRAEIEALTSEPAERMAELMAEHAETQSAWDELFPNIGPPPVEFLGFPTAKVEMSRKLLELGDVARAATLLEQATETVASWVKEVTELRQRCAPAWRQAQEEGRAWENVIGMRFVKVGETYWSVWETRIMDFARYWNTVDVETIRLHQFQSPDARWMDPGFPIGPTHPVVFIEPKVAWDFTTWLAKGFPGTIGDSFNGTGLPSVEDWDTLTSLEPQLKRSEIKRAFFPNVSEFEIGKWSSEHEDPAMEPDRFLHPVGLRNPSLHGLYDLSGNAWEWAGNMVTVETENGARESVYPMYGGGKFGQVALPYYDPPDDHTAIVNRLDATGFRLCYEAVRVDSLLEAAR